MLQKAYSCLQRLICPIFNAPSGLLRAKKNFNIELPDDDMQEKRKKISPLDLRLILLKRGINPYRDVTPQTWKEYFNYKHGIKRIRKRKGFENFSIMTFPAIADEVYVEAHRALMARNKAALQKYVTEAAFGKMWPDVESGSIIWELMKYIEPSRVVSIRCADFPHQSGNDIAQIIVRMHTMQKVALYDRFGRLILGTEHEAKPVMEYVVFENHIASFDGIWRLHDKVYPEWIKPKRNLPRQTKISQEHLQIQTRQPLKLGGDRQLSIPEEK
ncbi:putative 39S ribosomal protein L45, mitochondrial [Dirofilaria immitis]|nr:putative 39S ribosomal protein L45, mitochondrial [Dirofilaria immitis]